MRAVFLDRDDTLTDTTGATASTPHPGDLVDPGLVTLLPGVAEACRRLAERGLLLIGISNQGGVARGATDLAGVHAVNQRIFELLPDERDVLSAEPHPHITMPARPSLLGAISFCPFHPRGTVAEFAIEHDWRKPAPGMILDAARRFDVDLAGSWLIGDAQRDIDAGIAAGIDPKRCLRIGDATDLSSATDHLLRSLDA